MTLTTEQQAKERGLLYSLLGDLPPRDKEVSAKLLGEEDCGSYVLERLLLDLNGVEPVPAYFTRPVGAKESFPVVLFNHSHGGNYTIGKDELISGREYMQNLPYAQVLAEQGWGALAIDAWNFGERRGRTESELFKELLWRGQVLWGLMVYDSLKAVDYLLTRPDVDGNRIATLGMSMGSTMAWWTAALDTRVKVCAHLCCTTEFEALIAHGGLNGHGIYYYVPGLLKHFSTADILSLICPRPHLSLNGLYDDLTPADGLEAIDRAMKDAYQAAGAPEAWRMVNEPHGHIETPVFRREMMAWLERYL